MPEPQPLEQFPIDRRTARRVRLTLIQLARAVAADDWRPDQAAARIRAAAGDDPTVLRRVLRRLGAEPDGRIHGRALQVAAVALEDAIAEAPPDPGTRPNR